MSELVTTISHQGREIIFLNCAGREEAYILRGFDDMLDTVIGSSVPTKALVLVDMSNTFSSMAVSKKGRDIAERGKRAACLICLPRLLVSGVYKRQWFALLWPFAKKTPSMWPIARKMRSTG